MNWILSRARHPKHNGLQMSKYENLFREESFSEQNIGFALIKNIPIK